MRTYRKTDFSSKDYLSISMGELTAKTRGPFSATLFPFDLTSRNFQELTVGRS